jgi:bleomycin hydrolase
MEINPLTIQHLDKEFKKNDKYRIVQGVMRKTPILNVSVNQSTLSRLPARFNHDLAGETKATNQMNSGRCWIFAGLNVIRNAMITKYKLPSEFELSQAYLSRWDKLEKCNMALEIMYDLMKNGKDSSSLEYKVLVPSTIEDGGTWPFFAKLVKKYGIVPKEVVPETFSSEHTQRMNKMLLISICKVAAVITKNMTLHEFKEHKKKALDECYRIVTICMGSPPESFSWSPNDKTAEKQYTPMSFYKKIVKPLINVDKYVTICNYPLEKYDSCIGVEYINNVLGPQDNAKQCGDCYVNLDIKEFKKAIIKSLKRGKAVWFTCDIGQFLLNSGKVLDFKSSNLREMFDVDFIFDSKGHALQTRACEANHAMTFVGCHIEKGKVMGWKIENSHGDDSNNKGYITMSDSWFDEYVYTAAVPTSCIKHPEGKTKWLPFYCPLGTAAGGLAPPITPCGRE